MAVIFVYHYSIWPLIPENEFQKTLSGQNNGVPFRALSQRLFLQFSAAFSVGDSLLHICSNSSSCHNVFILLSLSGVINLSLLAGICATCMLAYRCLQIKWILLSLSGVTNLSLLAGIVQLACWHTDVSR